MGMLNYIKNGVQTMKAAIIYFSQSGNTQYVAKKLAAALNADLIPLVPRKAYPDSGFKKFFWGGKSALMGNKPDLEPYAFDGDAYDRIIFGSPVWAGTFAPPLRTFVEDNRTALQGKRLSAFFCCSGGPGKVLDKFKAFLACDRLEQGFILIDPKDKPFPETEEMIKGYIDTLQ